MQGQFALCFTILRITQKKAPTKKTLKKNPKIALKSVSTNQLTSKKKLIHCPVNFDIFEAERLH